MSGVRISAPPLPAPKQTAPPPFTPVRTRTLQRKCACGETSKDGECEECRKRQLQRSAAGAGSLHGVPSLVRDTLLSVGHPLDGETRAYFERSYAHDLSQVRIHHDAQAAASARAVDAHAYTVGQDIVFAEGEYTPHTETGRHLLAHELAHTIQQRGLQRSSEIVVPTGAEDVRLEQEAEAAADRIVRGDPAAVHGTGASAPRLSRAAKKAKRVQIMLDDGGTRQVSARDTMTVKGEHCRLRCRLSRGAG
jgi:hypothetical protein